MKKVIYWGIFIAFVVGSMIAGSPFNLIDLLVVRPIVNILFVIFNLVHDFGLAIIIFTVLVKLLMLPLAKKQLNQTRLIRKIQPELTQIKKDCRGNKQLESLRTMDLYRRYNVKPFSSVVTMLIQFPIFIAIFSAISVIAVPKVDDNLSNRAYSFVAYQGSEIASLEEKQKVYLEDLANPEIPEDEKAVYDFEPRLFGVVNLNAKASDILAGKFSPSAFFILACAVIAAVLQYFVARQQMPSGKSERSTKFRDLIKEAKAGRELDETDVQNLSSKQMAYMMPMMMFFVMFNLNGALAFYYFLTNVLSLVQQKLILKKVSSEIDAITDKAVLKELRNIQEGEVIKNKKTGTKIKTRTAREIKEGETVDKKKRRK